MPNFSHILRLLFGNIPPDETPLPKLQMTCVVCVQLCEAFSMNILFPFVFFMVKDFDIAKEDSQIGFYVGILGGSFCFAQFFSSFIWGRISDVPKIGRKNAIVGGLFGSLVGYLIFGFSTTYYQAVIGRVCSGLFNGNMGIQKSLLVEITDESNRSRAFSWLSLAWGIGVVIAPSLSGILADQDNLPFKDIFDVTPFTIFKTFPYLLPILIVGCTLQVFTIVFAIIFMRDPRTEARKNRAKVLEESSSSIELQNVTQNKKIDNKKNIEEVNVDISSSSSPKDNYSMVRTVSDGTFYKNNKNKDVEENEENEENRIEILGESENNQYIQDSEIKFDDIDEKPGDIKEIFKKVPIVAIMSYGFICAIYISFDEVVPIFFATPIEQGGLHFNSIEIGIALGVAGISLAIFTFYFVPSITKRWGYLRVYQVSLIVDVFILGPFPIVGYLATKKLLLWPTIILILCMKQIFAALCFIPVMILVNNSVTPNNLGTINGIGQSVGSLARGIGPFAAGATYSFSLDLDIPFNIFLVFVIISIMCIVAFCFSLIFPKDIDNSSLDNSEEIKDISSNSETNENIEIEIDLIEEHMFVNKNKKNKREVDQEINELKKGYSQLQKEISVLKKIIQEHSNIDIDNILIENENESYDI
eukprot:TRINITY_DN2412_c0_g1_i1.p1 TRINITY_DN2412_c0_g1~~TRINITY_DN2412_c0_g1_i1.p1  ORF type:complete len:644 (+),score=147.35 TRINITY_DN2412_c0_g1_i1:28-1959(+)